MQYRRIFFRVVYGSIYFLFYLILVGLLLITPGDAIERSLQNGQNYNVLIVTISYVVTVVIVCFVYVLRLYINKTALAAIPKAWVPVEKGDVKDAVHKMIGAGLNRSAAIAYEARPRVDAWGREREPGRAEPQARVALKKMETAADEFGITLPPHRAAWGEIEHCGWASPNSPDLPNLQYSTVLSELPNLIEAKALTMAPADQTSPSDPPMLDPEATGLLQRMPNMGLRDYVDYLADTGVINTDKTMADFLSQYEHARFSNRPISDARFRELMHLFAEMLRAMQPLDLGAPGGKDDDWAPSESDIDNDAPRDTNPPSPHSSISRAETASTHGSVRRPVMRNSSAHAWSFRTAPNTPGSRRTGMLSRKSSNNSFAQSRRPYPVSQPSSSSLRSKASSSDSGSVIRLATREDPETLPYVLNLRATTGS
ncbi:hypothetical protein TOPH_01305 [Tolypocladium ophioglossoides CBS 100239]|uniref:Defect at low temperature protein 1 n=1 Tax=Tolypocladium ophioglossoides (strain CBS 100239) TaxID=1163406 RepID=A0A0L0NLH8_TOLOC|nr:hypothetical protein TOPH_01305 [Tolypocladium ophioglossoides CBS 100239]